VLPVNLAAIVNAGDTTTNYQLMPGDRLVVYRDPIVRTSVFLNRIAEPFFTVVNGIQIYSFASQSLRFLNQPIQNNANQGLLNNTLPNAANPALGVR
jgi:polysaccharide export outer membrane protein